ncbi:MAG: right-handed parallel beta-helix repeat-containing protein [Candidatus Hodarchaeales archaeon]|jgi:parallel beta-helix repeat protein
MKKSIKLHYFLIFILILSVGNIVISLGDYSQKANRLSNELYSKNASPIEHSLQHFQTTGFFYDIVGNDQFFQVVFSNDWPGKGVPTDPIIISEYSFEKFHISNTTVHFRVVDCTFKGSSNPLRLLNVSHCEIENSEISHNQGYGIYAYQSSYLSIRKNQVHHNSHHGIILEVSENCLISSNEVFNNTYRGIELSKGSKTNNITNNNVYSNGASGITLYESCINNVVTGNSVNNPNGGIYLRCSSMNVITNNELLTCGLFLFGWTIEEYTQIKIENNSINTKPILFWQHHQNDVISTLFGQVILVNCSTVEIAQQTFSDIPVDAILAVYCSNLLIHHNTFVNVTNAIRTRFMQNSTIIDNHMTSSKRYGVDLEYSCSYNLITVNRFCNNEIGIGLKSNSSDNQIVRNVFVQSKKFGIEISTDNNLVTENYLAYNFYVGVVLGDSYGNIISENNFITNNLGGYRGGNSQARDDNPPEYIYNKARMGLLDNQPNTFSHNYWNDWTNQSDSINAGIADLPYLIDGDRFNQDNFSLKTPIHRFFKPNFVFPSEGEVFSGNINVLWFAAFDLLNHNVTYELSYSVDQGASWKVMVSNVAGTWYVWNHNLQNNSNFVLKVVARCPEGLTTEDISTPFLIIYTKDARNEFLSWSPLNLCLIAILAFLFIKERYKSQ